MRILPIITAVLVCVALILLVLRRDEVQQFAASWMSAPDQEQAAEDDAVAAAEAAEMAASEGDAMETPAEADAAEDHRIQVVVRRSEASLVDSAVRLRGRTEASRMVEVRAETAGRITSAPIRAGAEVEAGQILCEIDPGTRAAALAEAVAGLAEARARLPEAQARVAEARARLSEVQIEQNAATRLSQDGFASETRVANAEAAVAAAEAAIESAEAGVEAARSGAQSAEAGVARAELELERLTIRAPFGGVLDTDTAELGELLQTGGLCATILQLDPITLVGFLPEIQVGSVQVGAEAGAIVATGEQVAGNVTFISRASDPATRTFRVEIEIANPESALRDGQSAEIFITAEGNLAHTIPGSALTLNNEGDLGVRIVGDGDITRFVPVRMIRDTPQGMVVAGLPQQADIIVVGQEYVSDGVPLAPVFEDEVNQ